jgi:transcription elongation GreA/GreB family factor
VAQQHGVTAALGSRVRIRGLRRPGRAQLPPGIEADDAERVIAIVPPGEVGLYRLSPRMPLAGALLGHRAGDVVPVAVKAGTVEFEVLAVEPGRSIMELAGVAELADAAVLNTAPAKGPGSSPGTGTMLDAERAVAVATGEQSADTHRLARVGDVVHVRDGELEEWWRIVPPDEADAARRCISEKTPMALALLGHRAGDVVRVRAPGAPRGWPVTILAVYARGAGA